jgi:LPS O-antigen subunit length determinant protein (WzzB/FepE family)
MKKKSLIVDEDEIHLIDLLQIIWENKIKIFMITIISSLIGCGYYYQLPKDYLNSLNINKIDNYEIFDLRSVTKMISSSRHSKITQENNDNYTSQKLLVRFIDELEDYEEFFINLKNTKKIKKNIENLSIEDQEIKLFKYANLLEIVRPTKNEDKYLINFKWDDSDEARKILQDTLSLTHKNLQELIYENLKQTSEIEKKLIFSNDKERLTYLKEQSSIAKELGILDNQVDNVNLSQSNISFNINSADVAYYLRGYKAIDKEIELIKNRDYQKFKLIEQEINTLKKKNSKLVNYNVYSMNIKNLKNIKLVLMISILLGLVIGVFYVFIFNAFQSINTSKKI